MKKNRFTYQLLSIMILLMSLTTVTWSITDEEIVQGLEALGDWEAAYPLAYQLAQQKNTYQGWRDMVIKYTPLDNTIEQAYLQLWQHAYTLNQEAIYRDFLTVKPQSPLNRYAIHALFQLVQASEDINQYQKFIEEFPDVVESIEALMKSHEIAFNRAKKANDPLVFDAFVLTFHGAKQIPQAIELAFQTEKQWVETELRYVTNYEQREYIARRLYNEARIAEKEHDSLMAARKYRLLNLKLFIDTQVFTELLDREERLAYRKLMETKQDEILQSINSMQEAMVETFQIQVQHLQESVVTELQNQGLRLENTLTTYNILMQQGIEKINANLEITNKNLQQGYLGGVGADVAQLVPFIGAGFKIAKVIGRLSPAIARALAKPNKQQAVLFAKQ